MTKQQEVNLYNQLNPGYDITGIYKMSGEQLVARIQYGVDSLYDLYKHPSNAKVTSYNAILNKYKPKKILADTGSCMHYSVLLIAENNDTLLITKNNNYLVKKV